MAHPTPVLVLNGDLEWTEDLARLALRAPVVFAADGGANALARLGVRPNAVIGDLDSIDPGVKAWIGEEYLVHRPDQSATDFEKALRFVFKQPDIDRLVVLGALGGRLDHTIGNLSVLAREARGTKLLLVSEREQVLASSEALDLESRPGETWAFWTFDPDVRITIEGVRWPVENAPVTVGERPSISNEATGTQVTIKPSGGSVVVWRALD